MSESKTESVLLRAARMYVKGYEPQWPQPVDEIHKVLEFKEDPTELACAYVSSHDECERLRAERDHAVECAVQALTLYKYDRDLSIESVICSLGEVVVGSDVAEALAGYDECVLLKEETK